MYQNDATLLVSERWCSTPIPMGYQCGISDMLLVLERRCSIFIGMRKGAILLVLEIKRVLFYWILGGCYSFAIKVVYVVS